MLPVQFAFPTIALTLFVVNQQRGMNLHLRIRFKDSVRIDRTDILDGRVGMRNAQRLKGYPEQPFRHWLPVEDYFQTSHGLLIPPTISQEEL